MAQDSVTILEEVVVTATKRETNLMDTPIAISAFDQAALIRNGIKDARDMGQLVPNLQLSISNSDNAVEFTLRGVGSSNNTELGDPNVGFHIDGIYSPRPQGAMALMYDLERLEVLRGPQGTLFGRNSTVGSINLITAKPDLDAFSGELQAEVGNYQHKQLRGTLNTPINDTLALRGNFFINRADSYIDHSPDFNRADQRRAGGYSASDSYGNSDQWAARLSALWQPTDTFSWQLAYEQFQDDSAGGQDLADCDRLQGSSDACDQDFWSLRTNVAGQLDLNIESVRSNIHYDLNDQLRLSYHVGYADQERQQFWDGDGGLGGTDIYLGTQNSDYESISHELQLQSTGTEPLQWIIGYFNFKEDNAILFDVDLPYLWQTGATPAPGDTTGSATHGHGALYFLQPERISKSEAYFAQGTYEITEKLNLTLGYRHTKDKKEDKDGGNYACFSDQIDGCYLNGEQIPTLNNGLFGDNRTSIARVSDNSIKRDWSKDTFRVVFDYALDENLLLFASYATGFKSGIFTDVVTVIRTGEEIALDAGPEEVATWELGTKARLLDGSMNLSAVMFFSDYSDMQVTTVKNFGPIRDPLPAEDPDTIPQQTQLVTENAAESSINGFELEIDWAPTVNSRFTGYLAWLDARVDEWITQDTTFCDQRFGSDCPVTDLEGNRLPRSPRWSLNLSYEYHFDLHNGATITPWIAFHWEDEYYLRPFNVDKAFDINSGQVTDRYTDKEDSFINVDATLRYQGPQENWYIELYGKNLTDETVKNRFAESEGILKGTYNPPRFYGVRAGFSF